MDKPNCMQCEHNKEHHIIFRKCEAGAFSILSAYDCKDLPYYFLKKCPKYKEQIKNQVTNKTTKS